MSEWHVDAFKDDDATRQSTQDKAREPSWHRVLKQLDPRMIQWLILVVAAIVCFVLADRFPAIQNYPVALTLPIQAWLNAAMEVFVDAVGPAFLLLSWLLEQAMNGIQAMLLTSPWVLTIAALSMLAYFAGNIRVAILTAAALLYMALIGYWDESMRTLALVLMSVPLAVLFGFLLGSLAFLSPRAEQVIQPLLNFMQTVPAFAYLIPALILLGFGPVVGLFVAIIYASPPFARNLLLGLKRVPSETVEAGITSGATPAQLFWQVRLRSATSTLLIGLNQTTMAALNMVIIASMIGSSADIGWEVLSTMRKAQFGESMLAGLVIVLMAITMDRITRAFAHKMGLPKSVRALGPLHRRIAGPAVTFVAVIVAIALTAYLWPALHRIPEQWIVNAAAPLNAGLNNLITTFSDQIEQLKRLIAFYFMMPLRLGLSQAISPFTWGIEFTPTLRMLYAGGATALAAFLFITGRWPLAIVAICACTVAYFGFSQIPWLVIVGLVALLAWQTGGWGSLLMSLAGMGFILASGLWPKAVLSIYLCTAAVLIAFSVGVTIGIIAARSNAVSTVIRPINDALQTMPLFVFLIPVIMVFGIGEFAALVAIFLYAVVPAIRYTEHGLRNLPASPVEAAVAMGCTPFQKLINVELPLALPEIMLGLNQTIMFSLAMLVIAALVGTSDLGQVIYTALSSANFGAGMAAGISMALIALIADRIIQCWSENRKKALGL